LIAHPARQKIMQISDKPQFSNLPDKARRVFASATSQSFFNLPEWYDLITREGLESHWTPRLYLSDNAALVACAPSNGPFRELRGCCNMYSIEHDIIVADAGGDAKGEVRRLLTQVATAKPRADSILLPGLDPNRVSFASALAGLKDGGFLAKPYFSWSIWFEPLMGRDFDSYFDGRPSVLRNTWRRKLASLEKSRRAAFRTSDQLDVEGFITLYDQVYRRSWKEPEPFPGFMPALMRMAAQKQALRFGVLEIDGTAVAAQFWIVWCGRAIIYKLAYDEKWTKFSPGTLLTMHMIRHVLERDHPEEINFGRGDDDYKKLWMSARRERWGIEAANLRTPHGLSRSLRLCAGMLRNRVARRRYTASPGPGSS
jgi:hypothetical protein